MIQEFRYFVNEDEVFPLSPGLSVYKYDKAENASVVYEKNIDDKFTFKYSEGYFNFKSQESFKCEELDFRIERKCGNIWGIDFEGVFVISEGEFDDDRCLYTVAIRKKEYLLQDLQINIFDEPNKVFEGGVIGVKDTYFTGFTYPNWRYFDKILAFVASKSNPKIKGVISNFFQINPDGPFYFPFINRWDHMVIGSVSDIKDPVPSDPATRELVTFRQLMIDLKIEFNVEWKIDSNYYLRIEHVTYFEGVEGLDLTGESYSKYLKAKNKYTYDLSQYYKKEIWKTAEADDSISFLYSGLANVSKDENEKTYATSLIRTDWENAKESYNDGVILVPTDGGITLGYWIREDPQYISLHYLVPNFHLFNRPTLYALATFFRNNQVLKAGGLISNSILPTKAQEEIQIPLCCDEFKPEDNVITPMGIGYVDKAEFDSKTKMIKLLLKYKVDNCDGFQPSDLNGLDLWLKYNDVQHSPVIGSFDIVTQWNDSSGNNRHAVPDSNATAPFYKSDPNGSPVFFTNEFPDPSDPSTFIFRSLKTPAFQLFPNKRGTVIIILNYGGDPYTGFPSVYASLISPAPVLSTQDGGAGVPWDLSFDDDGTAYSTYEGKKYPSGFYLVKNGAMIIRRSSDISLDKSYNGTPSPDNPMNILNTQPSSKQLILGDNQNVYDFSRIAAFISEVIVFGRDLTDEEIEKIQFYLIKKKLLTV